MDFQPDQSLAGFNTAFAELHAPTTASLNGDHRGTIIGTRFQRAMGGPLLVLTRLGGWWGKRISPDASGLNIVERRGGFRLILPMEIRETTSLLDGKPVVHVLYPKGSPLPWPFMVDELRRIDEHRCLGLTVFRPLKWVTSAFLLSNLPEDLSGLQLNE